MQIRVKYIPSEHDICVVYDGSCNHADVRTEVQDEEFWNHSTEDIDSFKVEFIVCNGCGSYKLEPEDDYSWRTP